MPVEKVKIILGDTDVVKVGGGSHSGRSMRHAATVFSKAAVDLIDKGKQDRRAGDERRARERRVSRRRPLRRRATPTTPSISSSSPRKRPTSTLPDDLKGGVAVVTDNEMHEPVFPNGTAICEVEVDPDTGSVDITRYASVDDVGRCINPLIVHGQTHGAHRAGRRPGDVGAVLCRSGFGPAARRLAMDYGMPRADALPSFTCEIAEVLSPTNPLGIKAGGEGGTTPRAGGVVSAVVDALSVYGIRDITMPADAVHHLEGASRTPSSDRGNDRRWGRLGEVTMHLELIAFPARRTCRSSPPWSRAFSRGGRRGGPDDDAELGLPGGELISGKFHIAGTAFDNVVAYKEGQGAVKFDAPSPTVRVHGRDPARAWFHHRARNRELWRTSKARRSRWMRWRPASPSCSTRCWRKAGLQRSDYSSLRSARRRSAGMRCRPASMPAH